MGKVTIQSIAKELGLSRNTVSMALKGNDMVAPRTRDMILRYAERAGYMVIPGQDRETEKDEKTEYRVMILKKPDVAVYWDKIVNGISEEASRHHCRTQVAVVSPEDEAQMKLPPGLDENIQAVFCVRMMAGDYIGKIQRMGIRLFFFDDYIGSKDAMTGDVLKTESFHPIVQITNHLIGQGMKKIGFLGDSSHRYESMHSRYDGYQFAMAQAGLVPNPEFVMPYTESGCCYLQPTYDAIVENYRELPEAMVCGNDQIAMYFTRALRRKGIRVPEDVAVTGFDNDEEGMLDPFFTTVDVDTQWLGRRMVQCFLWRMQCPDAPYEKISVSGKVVIRRSSLKPALGTAVE